MRMYQVDAFTDQVSAENPAAVLVLEGWLTDDPSLSSIPVSVIPKLP
ncbi:PhzF family phenazine biosynthesis protein [Thioclava sp. F28-4]|nr:PhzF family phenazine biosynthesis protein [Thioclava sp. F28-4]